MSGQVVVSHTYMLRFKNLLVEDEPEVTDHSQICWNIPIVQPGGKTSDFTPSSLDQANQEKGLGKSVRAEFVTMETGRRKLWQGGLFVSSFATQKNVRNHKTMK